MIFILCTGRSGSKSIASLLNKFSDISCYHEPHPTLAYEVRAYLYGEISRQELIAFLKATRRSSKPEIIYGESNQKLSYIADVIQEAFPEAVFLWLIRNGLDVVASYYSRGAYRDDEEDLYPTPSQWVKHRIKGYEVSEMSEGEWNLLDSFARNCWFWAWTNKKIKYDLMKIRAKWLLIRLEDLDNMVGKIATFLGLSIETLPEVPILNFSIPEKITKVNYWDCSQRQNFIHYCGDMMDELYPEWQNTLKLSGLQIYRNELLSFFSSRHKFGRYFQKTLKRLPSFLRNPIIKISDGHHN